MGNCCGSLHSSSQHGTRLGGGQEGEITRVDRQESMQTCLADRQKALDAAEERRQAKQGGGKLAKKLQEQNQIGPGRAVDSSVPTSSSGATFQWKAEA